jgi:polygalacturonase
MTGPIHLRSRVNLHLAEGAIIRFSTRPEDYLPPVFTRWEGMECLNYSPLVYAVDCVDVAVTGHGLLDGQASNATWWRWKGWPEFGWSPGSPEQRAGRKRLHVMAEAGLPAAERSMGEGSFLRPNFIQFYRCDNVLVEGLRIIRSPMWALHPVLCRNVVVRGVTVDSQGPNNDGCDPESCRDVLIEDCVFNTGDDCVAVKSGRNADGRRLAAPSENIVVRHCRMRDGHGGVVIGSEVSGGCRNVFVEDCVMSSPNLERALRIKTNSHRGGVVENIHMRRIEVGEVSDAVLRINFYYEEGEGGAHTPVVRNIQIEDLTSRRSRCAFFLAGYERSPVQGVTLRNCRFYHIERPAVIHHVAGLLLDRVEQATGDPLIELALPED